MALPPFQRFLDEQRDVVWRFLVASVGRDAADDCFQETFLSALRAYPRLRHGEQLRSWVLTIAHRKAIDHHRARTRAPLASDAQDEIAAPAAVADEPPGDSWELVRELPLRQRQVLLLRYAADLSHREVAVAVGCSEEASRQAAREGLRRLRQRIGASR